jgi:hypothetical protein
MTEISIGSSVSREEKVASWRPSAAAPSIAPPAFCSSATSVPASQPRFSSKIGP